MHIAIHSSFQHGEVCNIYCRVYVLQICVLLHSFFLYWYDYIRSAAARRLNPFEGQLMHRIYPIHQQEANLTHTEDVIERTERFFYVSLNVIGFTTLTESLQDFTKEVALQFRWPSSAGTGRHLNAYVA